MISQRNLQNDEKSEGSPIVLGQAVEEQEEDQFPEQEIDFSAMLYSKDYVLEQDERP